MSMNNVLISRNSKENVKSAPQMIFQMPKLLPLRLM